MDLLHPPAYGLAIVGWWGAVVFPLWVLYLLAKFVKVLVKAL